MRVLQLIASTGSYGAEAVVASLASRLAEFGIESVVGHVRYANAVEGFRLEDHLTGAEVIAFEHQGWVEPGLVRRLRDVMRERKIDVVHSHGYKTDLYGGAAAGWLGVPMVSTCHLWTRSTPRLRAYAQVDGLVLRGFDGVVAVSEPIYQDLLEAGIQEQKLTLISNGICAERFQAGEPRFRKGLGAEAQQPGAIIFGAACRQVAAKGIDLLLRAAMGVVERYPMAQFLIAGDGPKRGEYEALARSLGLGARVTFLGNVAAMADFYASLDVFMLPSLDEGLPIALLEAMASGLPVVATAVGSVGRVVRNEENGLLITKGDGSALTAAMLSLAESDPLRERLGAAARREVLARHTEVQMVGRYAELYRAVAKGNGVSNSGGINSALNDLVVTRQ